MRIAVFLKNSLRTYVVTDYNFRLKFRTTKGHERAIIMDGKSLDLKQDKIERLKELLLTIIQHR